MAGIMGSKSFIIMSAVLLAQAGMFYGFARNEKVPDRRPLADFRIVDTPWENVEEFSLSQDELDVLKADDILSRLYKNQQTGYAATLFVAFFDTQRTGKAPHSPKNCLPGSGYVPTTNDIVELPIAGMAQPLQVNRYVVTRGDSQSVVLYWYQSHNRTVASEYWAKYYTVEDALRYNRSDTALVRIVVPVANGDTKTAIKIAEEFAVACFPQLKEYLPA